MRVRGQKEPTPGREDGTAWSSGPSSDPHLSPRAVHEDGTGDQAISAGETCWPYLLDPQEAGLQELNNQQQQAPHSLPSRPGQGVAVGPLPSAPGPSPVLGTQAHLFAGSWQGAFGRKGKQCRIRVASGPPRSWARASL